MVYRYIFFSSLSLLFYEILLLRIFSIKYAYHYGSLVLSIAMMGLVAGSLTFYSKTDFLKRFSIETFLTFLFFTFPSLYLLFYFLPFDYIRLIFEKKQLLYMFLFVFLCSIPFFLYGIILSFSFYLFPERSERIYGFDLLGASIGILLPHFFLSLFKIETIFCLLSLFILLSLIGLKRRRLSVLIFAFFCFFFLFRQIPILPSPYKGLMILLKDDGRLEKIIDSLDSRLYVFRSEKLRFAPGLSLLYQKPVPTGIGLAVDGDIKGVVLPLKYHEFFDYIPSSLPYKLLKEKGKKVLIIGFKSNIEILTAYYLTKGETLLTERDASLRRFIEKELQENRIFMTLSGQGGRAITKKTKGFDIISLSETSFVPSHPFGLEEDFYFTKDAIKDYLTCLNNGGILYIELFILPPPRAELRVFLTILLALKELGKERPEKSLLAIRTFDTLSFIVKKGGFKEEEIEKIRQIVEKNRWEILFPLVSERFFHSPFDLPSLFSLLMKNSKEFMKKYPFDISPTTDDRPFSHYFLRISKIREIYELSSKKWVYFLYEGMTLPFLLPFLILLSSIFFLPLFLRRKKDKIPFSYLFFFLIGFSYMTFEIFLIHRFTLYFESPSKGFSFSLFLLLFFSGIGSLLSKYIKGRARFLLLALLPIFLLTSFFFQDIFFYLLPFFLFIFGLFFPWGLKEIAREKGNLPLAYGINGCASLISPTSSFLIALSLGFRILLVFSALLYFFALFLLCLSNHGNKEDWT